MLWLRCLPEASLLSSTWCDWDKDEHRFMNRLFHLEWGLLPSSASCWSVTVKVLQNNSYQWQAWPWFPVKLTWAEVPELYRQRRSQRRPTLPALPHRSEIRETSQCSAQRCAAQWGRSSASSLWHSHGAWLSLAVTSSGAVLNCKSRKSEPFICYTWFIQADTWKLSRNSRGKLLQLVLRLAG